MFMSVIMGMNENAGKLFYQKRWEFIKETKKTRKHAFDQESDLGKKRIKERKTLSTKKAIKKKKEKTITVKKKRKKTSSRPNRRHKKKEKLSFFFFIHSCFL